MDQQVLGREGPVADLDRFIRGLATRPGVLVIEGEAGIGKTLLWQAAVDAAAERGYRVLVARPAESETSLAYSGLADLLTHADEACLEGLPVPQRRALEIALHLSEPTGRSLEPRAIFAAFGGIVRSLSLDGPVLVAVDDQQWLDASSLSALEFASRRLGDARVGILTTARRALDADMGQRRGLPGAAVLRLDALSPGVLYQLIKARVGLSLPRPTVLRVHRTTGGNPFFALELARVLLAAGLPGASEVWPVPDDLREMVAARVERLPQSARSALLAIAAGAHHPISGFSPSDLNASELAGIVTIAPSGRVRFAHPLFASAIYENATVDVRRRVHAELAAEDGDPEERARHRALACTAADEEVAGLLDEAAAIARARGAPDVAAELAERSSALTPLDRPERTWRRRITAAEHHLHAGDLERARALLVELVERLGPIGSRSSALRLLGEVCYRLRYLDDAMRNLREAIAAAEGDLALRARAELDLAFVLFYSFGSFEEARATAHRALVAAAQLGDAVFLGSALAGCALADFVCGYGLDEDKLAQALSLEDFDEPIPIDIRPSLLAGLAFIQTDQLDRARAVLEPLCARLVDRGEESDLPDVLALLGRLECLAGNLAKAEQLADQGYELARQAGSDSLAAHTKAVRALVDAYAGRIDETRAAAGEAIELAGRSGRHLAGFWASTALGLLEVSLGRDESAVATLGHSLDLVEENGLAEPSRCSFLPDAIEALVRLGELDRADNLTTLLEARGRELDRRWAIVTGARCRALVLAGRGDVVAGLAALERTLPQLLTLGMPLELARTLIVKGQLERRRKHKRAARESLRRAQGLCEEMGATLWAERACSELARIARVREDDDLTETESRIAALAAGGLTNREIAATACLSQKTVEANLSRVYRKLGVRSRAGLGVRLADSAAQGASRQPGGG